MNSHNLQNSTITQHMSVLGGSAGCWFTPAGAAAPHQIPPTAPLRQKRQQIQPSHLQPQLAHQQLQQHGISPPGTFAPISPPGAPFTPSSQLPLSPKTPPSGAQSLPLQQMHMGHMNHHGMPNSNSVSLHSNHPMSTSAQSGLMLSSYSQQGHTNGSMATSLQSMPGMMQHQNHMIMSSASQHPQMSHTTSAMQQLQQQQQHANAMMAASQAQGLPDINSIQQGLPQGLRNPGKPNDCKTADLKWHHGKISRDRAEQLLHPRTDGLFLVRESTNFPGDHTLCVCFQNRVEHYRIKCTPNSTLTIDDEEFFENLPLLIDHYLQDADGLCTQLVKPLLKRPPGKPTATPLPAGAQPPPEMIQPQPNPSLQPQLQGPPKMQPPQQQQQQPPADHSLPPCLAPQAFVDAGWMIPEKDLEIRENIGKGEFGDVMLGLLNGQKVAVKILKDTEAASKFLAEASLMTSLKHENLVKLLGLVFNKQHICLVTEYMSKGSLVDYLRSRGRLHVTKRDQIMFAFDTCSGMEYLETRRVVHSDLAARNVLVSDTRRAKVADFGLAREEGGPDAAAKLPIKWTAPEALKLNKFSNKSDMWSFGILLWEIYSFGRVPYPRIPLADVVKHVEKGYKMEAPEGCPPELYDLMRQAWDLNPDTRPTFQQAKAKLAVLKANTPIQ